MEEPDRKRLRIDSEATTPVSGASSSAILGALRAMSPPTASDIVLASVRDKEYWFEDGSIIIVSEGVAFKLYKGLLAEHSDFFRSMFEVAQARMDPSEVFEGCPVITLFDSPNDFRALFRKIYPLNKNLMLNDHKVDISFISAILRLDHKFELKGLYDHALKYLTTYYTMNFDDWVEGRNAQGWSPEPIHAVGAINLARLTNTTSILPLAFYICATLGPEVARGYTLEDGSMERLSPDDLYLVLQMKARLATENAHSAYHVLQLPHDRPGCSKPRGDMACNDFVRGVLEYSALSKGSRAVASDHALESWMQNVDGYAQGNAGIMQGGPMLQPAPPPPAAGMMPMHIPANLFLILNGPGHQLPFAQAQGFQQPMNPHHALCDGCRKYLQKRDLEQRRRIWRKLPEFIGLTLPNWDGQAA